jgi:hypothetical protein
MAIRRRTDNTMAIRKRTDDTMAIRKRTDDTMAIRRRTVVSNHLLCRHLSHKLYRDNGEFEK